MEANVPDYVSKVLSERATTQFASLHVSRFRLPEARNPIVICVLKDEALRIVDFLRHYREAGIERFAIIDNGSRDGTHEFLAGQPDVDLYRKVGPFHWIPKQGWINRLIAHYGFNRWYIYVDADELIVFDGLAERAFADLTEEMERRGIRRARGALIDMYSEGPVLESRYEAGQSLIAAYPFFDGSGYDERIFKEIISVKGGPRVRVFGKVDAKFRPELTKYPLFTIRADEYMVNPHHIWPLAENFVSPRVLAVLHFKFLPDLSYRIRKAIELRNYWDESFEYRCYLQAIEVDPSLSLWESGSLRYRGPEDLIAAGLMEPLRWGAASSLALAADRARRLKQARLRSAPTVREARQANISEPIVAEVKPDLTSQIEIADSDFVGFVP